MGLGILAVVTEIREMLDALEAAQERHATMVEQLREGLEGSDDETARRVLDVLRDEEKRVEGDRETLAALRDRVLD